MPAWMVLLVKCGNQNRLEGGVFLFFANAFIFCTNKHPGHCRHRPGHSLGKKHQHEMETNIQDEFLYSKNILKPFASHILLFPMFFAQHT